MRNEIYGWVVAIEQDNHLELAGTDDDFTQFCLPLRKIRPPALARVCRTTRYEFLPVYFKQRCFRLYTYINAFRVFQHRGRQQRYLVRFEEQAEKWLDSLENIGEVSFRNLQFRILDLRGRPLGGSLNIRFLPKRNVYEAEFSKDDGWPERQFYNQGSRRRMPECMHRFMETLKGICVASEDEVMTWATVKKLRDGLSETLPPLTNPRQRTIWMNVRLPEADNIVSWKDEARLGACSV